jgi:AcrR family transcriptional regulator
MPRLTRAESQARTRDQLIATAEELFRRDGYSATSLDKVADAAGYSKGAVYSNFRNKDELCLAVLDKIHAEQAELIGAALSSATSLEDRFAAFQSWAERSIGDPQWTTLEVEFAANVRRDPRLRDELASRDRMIRDTITELISGVAEEWELDLPMPAEDIATSLLSLGIGLGVQRAIDPAIPARVLTDTMRVYLRAAQGK